MHRAHGDGPVLRARWGLRSLAMLLSPLAHLPRVWRSPRLDGPQERLRASLTLLRLRALRAGWMISQAMSAPQK